MVDKTALLLAGTTYTEVRVLAAGLDCARTLYAVVIYIPDKRKGLKPASGIDIATLAAEIILPC